MSDTGRRGGAGGGSEEAKFADLGNLGINLGLLEGYSKAIKELNLMKDEEMGNPILPIIDGLYSVKAKVDSADKGQASSQGQEAGAGDRVQRQMVEKKQVLAKLKEVVTELHHFMDVNQAEFGKFKYFKTACTEFDAKFSDHSSSTQLARVMRDSQRQASSWEPSDQQKKQINGIRLSVLELLREIKDQMQVYAGKQNLFGKISRAVNIQNKSMDRQDEARAVAGRLMARMGELLSESDAAAVANIIEDVYLELLQFCRLVWMQKDGKQIHEPSEQDIFKKELTNDNDSKSIPIFNILASKGHKLELMDGLIGVIREMKGKAPVHVEAAAAASSSAGLPSAGAGRGAPSPSSGVSHVSPSSLHLGLPPLAPAPSPASGMGVGSSPSAYFKSPSSSGSASPPVSARSATPPIVPVSAGSSAPVGSEASKPPRKGPPPLPGSAAAVESEAPKAPRKGPPPLPGSAAAAAAASHAPAPPPIPPRPGARPASAPTAPVSPKKPGQAK